MSIEDNVTATLSVQQSLVEMLAESAEEAAAAAIAAEQNRPATVVSVVASP